jgi:NitT/TauT family transport system permease protein
VNGAADGRVVRIGSRHRFARARRGAVGLGLLFVVLEILTRAELVSPAYLPPVSGVLATTGRLLVDPSFLVHVAGTVAASAGGLALAAILAVPAGLLLGSSRRADAAAVAAVELLRPIPSVALIPLAILLLGRGIDMRIALVVYAASWPILLNTVAAVRQVDPLARETAHAFGLGRVAVVRSVTLPSAAPFVATGIRVSAAIALIVAISAELIAGGAPGIGTWMLANSQAGVPRELLYSGIVVAGLLGVATNAALGAAERRLFAWHQRVRPVPT